MNWIVDGLLQLSGYLKPYTAQLSVALVATLLVIYGNSINKTVRVFVKGYPFALRITAFVLLCTLGYGTLTVWGSKQLNTLMVQIPDVWFAPITLLAFILVGVLAERFHKT